MADKRITDLQLRNAVVDSVNFPADDGIQSYRVTAAQVKDYVLPDAGLAGTKLNASVITGQTLDPAPSPLDSILTYDESAAALRKTTLESLLPYYRARQWADNAEFRFFQRQDPNTLTNKTDTENGPDRWFLLTSGGAVPVASMRVQESAPNAANVFACQVRQNNATARNIGLLQALESDVMALRGKTVTLSIQARTDGVEVPNLRMGIIEWNGAIDAPPRAIVSAWAATPTLVSNAVFRNAPVDLPLTTSFQKFSTTVTLGNAFNKPRVLYGIFLHT